MSYANWRRGPLSLTALVTGGALALFAGYALVSPKINAPGQEAAAQQSPQGQQGQTRAAAIEAARVEAAPLTEQITAVGSLVSNESVTISPEIAGRVTKVNFQEGRRVEEGDVLFELDSSIYRAQVQDAEAKLKLAEQNASRAKELGEYATGRARDEAVSNVAVSQAAVDLAKTQLEKTVIAAPFSGIIGIRRVSVGEYVAIGHDLVGLEDIDPIKAEFRVPEKFLPAVQVGQTIEVRVDAFPGEQFPGKVYAIDPRIDIAGRSILIRAEVANDDQRLRPGLFARVTLIFELKKDALSVPETALMPEGSDKFVYKVVDGKAMKTQVTIGVRREGRVEIVSGLSRGDEVVTAGHLRLKDGAPVAMAAPAGV
jgi:membrane fusion protein (multidrug efflux system)